MEVVNCSSNHKLNRSPQFLYYRFITLRQCLTIFLSLLILQLVFSSYSFYLYRFKWTNSMRQIIVSYKNLGDMGRGGMSPEVMENGTVIIPYKYPMVDSTEVAMDLNSINNSSYKWFMSKKIHFMNLVIHKLTQGYSISFLLDLLVTISNNICPTGPITVNKTPLELDWIEKQHWDVKGGYYAPADCRPTSKVAIIVSYRDRKHNLSIFLYYLHSLLKKQLLEYRIFVIEQFGREKWNKGTLYNIAYLETQRFGTWDCLIFHDVDTIPEHEGIIYGCSRSPMHFSAAVEKYQYVLPYSKIFGGVTALTPNQFESVNGYSNFFWNWGAEDDDMAARLRYEKYNITRYNISIARYASLAHNRTKKGECSYKLMILFDRYKTYKSEGLKTTHYKLISVTKNRLYTHLVADVNPNKIKISIKYLFQYMVQTQGKPLKLRTVVSRLLRHHRFFWKVKGTRQQINPTTSHAYFMDLLNKR